MNIATKTGINASKKVIHKIAGATGEFLGNKIADAVTKSYDDKILKRKPVEEIIIPPEKREEILNELREVLEKWNSIKYISY